MTTLLKKAFNEASRLSQQEQDIIAAWILEELASEQKWEKSFADSQDVLAQLADEALAEHSAGKTSELDLENL